MPERYKRGPGCFFVSIREDVGSEVTIPFGGVGGSAASRWPARAEGQGFLHFAPSAPGECPCNILRVGYHWATGTSSRAAALEAWDEHCG